MASGRVLRVLVLVALGVATSGCDWFVRASVTPTGAAADGNSSSPALSADGRYVAFFSNATNLVSGGTTGGQVFVRDLRTAHTQVVSVDHNGAPVGASSSGVVDISADGRYVVFTSSANNIVSDDQNSLRDVFVRDLASQTTLRVSVDPNGGSAENQSSAGGISGDGRHVLFGSFANNLVPGDTDGLLVDLFVRDLDTSITTRVSVDPNGGDPDGDSGAASISADGRYVAFESKATNLVAGDNDGVRDIFLRDMQTGTTTQISPSLQPVPADGDSFSPSISGNGRFVVFGSNATTLVANDANHAPDVFLRDLQLGTTTRVNVDPSGVETSGGLRAAPTVSDDGRFVAFVSDADGIVTGDSNGADDAFVRDMAIGITYRVSTDALDRPLFNNAIFAAPISGDGRYLAFMSQAAADGKHADDVFVRAVPATRATSVTPSHVGRGTQATLTLAGVFFPDSLPAVTAVGPGGGVAVEVTGVTSAAVQFTADVAPDAPVGPRSLLVATPGTGPGLFATSYVLCQDCLSVD